MSTDPIVELTISATSTCPKCQKQTSLKRALNLSRITEALDPINAQGYVRDAVTDSVTEVRNSLSIRGWTENMCGGCRDSAVQNPVGIVGEWVGKNPKEMDWDGDCS